MKRIVSFIFISVCFFIFPLEILAKEETNKQEVPFEIYSIHYDNENIIIDGWGMLTEQQHFNSTTSHSYTLELVSDKNHYLSFSSEPKKNDQTENMRVYGNPMCGLDALHQSSSVCNYTYSNVGFTFSIPLNELKKGHSYSATLAITAHHTKVTKRTPLFYPILSPVSKTIGTVQYKVGASLYDTSLKVAQDAVFELKEPQKGKYRAGNVYCAGHGYIRYYRQHSVYKNIYDRYFDGKTTFYKVKTNQFSQCVGGRNLVEEGNDYSSWIMSNFVDYAGESLHIEVIDLDEAPSITILEHPTIEKGSNVDLLQWVSAFDKEDGDLTQQVKQMTLLDSQTLGLQQIEFEVYDSTGKRATAVMNVTVIKGNTPPLIEAYDQIIYQYEPFDPLKDVQASDEEDGNLSRNIQVIGEVNTSILGKYPLKYIVEDLEGLKSEKRITVEVIRNPREKIRYISKKESKLFFRESIPVNWKDKIQFLLEQLEEPKIFAQGYFKK